MNICLYLQGANRQSYFRHNCLEDEAGVAERHLIAVVQGARRGDPGAERGVVAALDEDAVRRAEVADHPGAIALAVQLAVLARDVAGLGRLRQVDIDRPGLRIEPPDHQALADQRDLVAGRGAVPDVRSRAWAVPAVDGRA